MGTFKPNIKNSCSRFNDIFIKTFFLLSIITAFFIPNAFKASAATLLLSPNSGTYTKGSYFTVNVLVSSADKVMNAASGIISFPANLISVSSISKSSSIFGFWAQEPASSNIEGTISFEGVVLPPWYQGSSGNIISITFKALAPGTANLSFTSGSVLAADGSGTDITTGTGQASYTILDVKNQPTPTPSTGQAVLNITEIKRTDLTDPVASFKLSVSDSTYSVDHYEIQIDNNSSEIWNDDGSHIYKTPIQEAGNHTLLVKAVSKLGNILINSAQFFVQSLEAPIITNYPINLKTDDILSVSGTTKYFNSEADLYLKDSSGYIRKYISSVDSSGNFTVVSTEGLKDGTYTIWAEITDSRGAVSSSSKEISISVRPPAIIIIGNWAISFLDIFIPLLSLIILLILLLWYAWRRFFLIDKKVDEAEDAIHKAFDLLKESVVEQIRKLEKVKNRRELTEEEEEINNELKNDLEDAELYIRKEVKEIEKWKNKK